MTVPDVKGREHILGVLTRSMRLHPEVNLKKIAEQSPGYAGADLSALMKEAGVHSITRAVENALALDEVSITQGDMKHALSKVIASATREGFANVPNVSFEDIGSLGSLKEELTMAILEPIRDPERFAKVNMGIYDFFITINNHNKQRSHISPSSLGTWIENEYKTSKIKEHFIFYQR